MRSFSRLRIPLLLTLLVVMLIGAIAVGRTGFAAHAAGTSAARSPLHPRRTAA